MATRLAVSLLIGEYTRQHHSQDAPAERDLAVQLPPSVVLSLLGFLRMQTQSEGSSTPTELLLQLQQSIGNRSAVGYLGSFVLDCFHKIETPEDVEEVLDWIEQLVTGNGESHQSAVGRATELGLFIRTFLTNVHARFFEGVADLLDDIRTFIGTFTDARATFQEAPTHRAHPSGRQTADWTSEEVVLMLDKLNETKDIAEESSGESPLQERTAQTPSHVFSQYLRAVERRDYDNAVTSLHRYHDLVLTNPVGRRGSSTSRSSTIGGGTADTSVVNINQGMDAQSWNAGPGDSSTVRSANPPTALAGCGPQYAALNSAGLELLFNHFDRANDALDEAMRIGQSEGDHVCIAFALSWQLRLHQRHGSPPDKVMSMMQSTLEYAKELKLPVLQVITSLAQAENELLLGSSPNSFSTSTRESRRGIAAAASWRSSAVRPLHMWQKIRECVTLVGSMSVPEQSSSSSGPAIGMHSRQTRAQDASRQTDTSTLQTKVGGGVQWPSPASSVLERVWRLSGGVCLTSSAGWSVVGHRTLTDAYNELHSLCHHDSASSAEIALTVTRMALSRLWKSSKAEQDENVYSQALFFLAESVPESVLEEESIQRAAQLLLVRWCMHRGEITQASLHMQELWKLCRKEEDLPAYLDAVLAQALLYSKAEEYENALQWLRHLTLASEELSFSYLEAQALIATAQVRLASSPENPAAAMEAAFDAIAMSRKNHYDLLWCEANVALSQILIASGKAESAWTLLEILMSTLEEHGDVHLRGEALLTLAKAAMATSVSSARRSQQILQWLHQSDKLLFLSGDIESQMQVAYLESMVYVTQLDDKENADRCASRFLSLQKTRHVALARQPEGYSAKIDSAEAIIALLSL